MKFVIHPYEDKPAPKEEPTLHLTLQNLKGREKVVLRACHPDGAPIAGGMILDITERGIHLYGGMTPDIPLPREHGVVKVK